MQSIHAFGASTLGVPFLVLISLMLAGSIFLVVSRAGELSSEHRLDSLLSREVVFLLNNLVLVGLCFVIFWGTFFPLISEALTGRSASVGPPWFGRFVVPLSLVLVLLSGLGPVMAWRRTTAANLWRVLRVPVAAAAVVLVALLAAGVPRRPAAVLMLCLAAFVIAVVGQELARGVRARRAMTNEAVPRALVALVGRNRRRYGGYLVHVGIAVLFVGIAASTAFSNSTDVRLEPGDSTRVGGYDITYARPTGRLDVAPNGALEKIDLGAELRVRRGDGAATVVRTERSYFPSNNSKLGALSRYFEGEATSEVGLRTGLGRDFWAVVSPEHRRRGARRAPR